MCGGATNGQDRSNHNYSPIQDAYNRKRQTKGNASPQPSPTIEESNSDASNYEEKPRGSADHYCPRC